VERGTPLTTPTLLGDGSASLLLPLLGTPCSVYPPLFLALHHCFTLWVWPSISALEHLSCITCEVRKQCTKFDIERLQHIACYAIKHCTKFERNRINHGWVIDDLARFCRAILGSGAQLIEWFRVYVDTPSLNLRARAIIAALHFCFWVRIPCCIFKGGPLKV